MKTNANGYSKWKQTVKVLKVSFKWSLLNAFCACIVRGCTNNTAVVCGSCSTHESNKQYEYVAHVNCEMMGL